MSLNAGLLLLTVIAKAQPTVEVLPPVRVPPTEAEIAQVIARNTGQLTTCYERARSGDDTLVGGSLVVRVSIGPSGIVQSMKVVTATPSLRVLEPCFKEAVRRWAFPRSPRKYRTEFPLEFQTHCTMSISSVPWSEVWVDGIDTGRHTPFVDDRITCGEHKLTLKRPDLQLEKAESITLRAGQRFEHRYPLADGN